MNPAANRRLCVLLNPSSAGGKALRLLPEVESRLAALGMPYRIVLTESIEHAGKTAREAAAQGEVVVSMGGDGLVGALAAALRGSDATLGILPGGRGNDFARSLRIPKDLDAACQTLATGEIKSLDLGEANGKTFAGIAATGFEAVANELANRVKLIRGNLVYAYAGLRVLATWKAANFRIVVDGRAHEISGFSVAVANSRAHGGGIFVAPHAKLDDGLLEVVAVEHISKFKALAMLLRLFRGSHLGRDVVHTFQGSEIEVTADRPFPVYADGEHLTDLPVTVKVIPAALKVIVPAAESG